MENAVKRCDWCGDDLLYMDYHDNEWGRLVEDDRILFEFIVLESAQAGLSWITVLRKREAYREAYQSFDPKTVASFSEKDIERLLANPGIIRNRRKIESSISNAAIFVKTVEEFGSFASFIRTFLPDGKPIVNHPGSIGEVVCNSEVSDRMSKEMKRRGFRFFGTTICYSFLQATGFIDDHLYDCSFKGR